MLWSELLPKLVGRTGVYADGFLTARVRVISAIEQNGSIRIQFHSYAPAVQGSGPFEWVFSREHVGIHSANGRLVIGFAGNIARIAGALTLDA